MEQVGVSLSVTLFEASHSTEARNEMERRSFYAQETATTCPKFPDL